MSNGSVVAICIAIEARAPMTSVTEVLALAGQGLAGDRYANAEGSYNRGRSGTRQVTLINEKFVLGSGFMFHQTRRNIVTRNTELMYLIGKEFTIGAARMRGVKYCDPCLIPSTLAGKSIRFDEVFHDHGGLIADVIEGGLIRVDDAVVPPRKNY